MASFERLTPQELIDRIGAKLSGRPPRPGWHHFKAEPPPTETAPYAMVLGAGFSYGVVPLVNELMYETIGDYYSPEQDQSSMKRSLEQPASKQRSSEKPASEQAASKQRSSDVLRKESANFWREVNQCAARRGLTPVTLNPEGLPEKPGEAYQTLFTHQLVNELFASAGAAPTTPTFLKRMQQTETTGKQEALRVPEGEQPGARFLKGFLRYVLDPGCESGHGSTGRNHLNPAHIYLSALLEAQQNGEIGAFCRTIFTTNFDTLLQNALQMMNLLYYLTDRPEHGVQAEFQESAIHLVYVHGSILRYNPASAVSEVAALSTRNSDIFQHYLTNRDVITIGYSGWKDGLMAALESRDSTGTLYWCDMQPDPSPAAAAVLQKRGGRGAYVNLKECGGADGLMITLYRSLVSDNPARDPMEHYRQWHSLVSSRNQPYPSRQRESQL